MTLVVDASTMAAWAFKDETTPELEGFLERVGVEGAIVPGVWPFEIANVLLIGERRQRVTISAVEQFLGMLASLPIEIDEGSRGVIWGQVLFLAREHRLTVYDASYLELAMRLGLALATRDDDLRAAAQRVGVTIL